MEYLCTRGGKKVTGFEAVMRGLSEKGGLYVPSDAPEPLSPDALQTCGWRRIMAMFYHRFLPEWTEQEWQAVVDEAVLSLSSDGQPFDLPVRAANRYLPNQYFLLSDLFPTGTVFDCTAAVFDALFSRIKARVPAVSPLIFLLSDGDEAVALLSRNGRHRDGRLMIFLPGSSGREAEMAAAGAENTRVIAFDRSFNALAKAFSELASDESFGDAAGNAGFQPLFMSQGYLLSVLTCGALLAAAMAVMVQSQTGEPEEKRQNRQKPRMDFVIPEGHLTLLSGLAYASSLGLPVGTIYLGESAGGVMADLLQRGLKLSLRGEDGDSGTHSETVIPINLERILFEVLSRDETRIAELFGKFRRGEIVSLSGDEKSLLQQQLNFERCSGKRAQSVTVSIYDRTDYLIDQGTAEAVACWESHARRTDGVDTCIVIARSPLLDEEFCARALFGRKNVRTGNAQNVMKLAEEAGITPWPLLVRSFENSGEEGILVSGRSPAEEAFTFLEELAGSEGQRNNERENR